MITRPLVIEPNSGTKLAGKKVVLDIADDIREILFVGNESIFYRWTSGEEGKGRIDLDWLEVLPDSLPAHEEFFKNYGSCDISFSSDAFIEVTIEELYQAFESRILAKLGEGKDGK